MDRYLWMIGGEAGFGIMTSGLTFSKIVSRSGYNVFDYIEYPSLIRGGHNAFEAVFSQDEVHGLKKDIDYLVCLNKETFDRHKSNLTSESLVLYDNEEFDFNEAFIKIAIPFKKIIHELKGESVMKNTIALGATLALMDGDFELLLSLIEKQFARKGEEIVRFNQQFAKKGHDHIKNNYSAHVKSILKKREEHPKQLVMSGNDAFSFGSVLADCRFFAAYPMTPSSSVLTTLAAWQAKTGMVVRHPEDEISVINTALGASFAGVRSSLGTSGGGFALMVEAVSLSGVTEIPVVIFLSQRPGPATGMPTWTEQGELLFAVHAGHGEFPKIILAPGDQFEMIELVTKAFNLADIYQTPVVVLGDMFLSESHKSFPTQKVNDLIQKYKVDRGKISKDLNERTYLRYKLTDDGISPMLIPGKKGIYYQANSYEHVEDGHTTEDAQPRKEQVDKRNRKNQTYLKNHFVAPNVYGDIEAAEIVFVSWGSTKGSILEAMRELEKSGKKVALVHFNHVYPLSEEILKSLLTKEKRYVLVENNSQGQFGRLLRQETGIELKEKLLKYDGRPFWTEEIVEFITKT